MSSGPPAVFKEAEMKFVEGDAASWDELMRMSGYMLSNPRTVALQLVLNDICPVKEDAILEDWPEDVKEKIRESNWEPEDTEGFLDFALDEDGGGGEDDFLSFAEEEEEDDEEFLAFALEDG